MAGLPSSSGATSLPFLEVKRRPGGGRQVFSCRLLERLGGGVVLLYVLSSSWEIGAVRLPRGTRTVAYFWPARPYNVYYWVAVDTHPVACYFNVARDTVIHPYHVEWTDLGLDLLVTSGGQAQWIDEEESARLEAADREFVAAARRQLEAVYPEVVAGVARESLAYREQVARA